MTPTFSHADEPVAPQPPPTGKAPVVVFREVKPPEQTS